MNEMTFEPVKSGFNMASCSKDQEGHFSGFKEALMGVYPKNGRDI